MINDLLKTSCQFPRKAQLIKLPLKKHAAAPGLLDCLSMNPYLYDFYTLASLPQTSLLFNDPSQASRVLACSPIFVDPGMMPPATG